jgi:hypothetical protein
MKKILFIVVLGNMPWLSIAQCRPANTIENQAYNRLIKSLSEQFTTQMPAGNWKVFHENHSVGKLEVTEEYGKIIRLCTDRYDLIVERADIAQQRKTKLDTMTMATQTMPSLYVHRDTVYRQNPQAAFTRESYTVSTEINLGSYRLQDPEGARWLENYRVVSIAGAAVAIEATIKPESKGMNSRQELIVLVGNWQAKEFATTDGYKRYKPAFKRGGAMAETLVITITAPLDIARQVAQKIDWKAIDNSLTK